MAITAGNEHEKELNKAFSDALRAWDIGKLNEMYRYEDRITSGGQVHYWDINPGDSRSNLLEEPKQFERLSGESWSNYIYRWYSNFTSQEERKMYVYHVVVVDTEKDEVVYNSTLVASSKERAHDIALANIMREIAPPNETVVVYHFAIEQIGNGYQK